MAQAPRVAATVCTGDVVHLADGTTRTVATTPTTSPFPIGGLMILIRFCDGTVLRVSAGAELDVERPA